MKENIGQLIAENAKPGMLLVCWGGLPRIDAFWNRDKSSLVNYFYAVKGETFLLVEYDKKQFRAKVWCLSKETKRGANEYRFIDLTDLDKFLPYDDFIKYQEELQTLAQQSESVP